MSDLTFNAFSEKIETLYGEKNSTKSFEEIYSYLCRNSSYLSRAILRGGDSELFFIKSFSWLFAVAQKNDIDISSAFRRKFPNVCPYCIVAPCKCAETHRAPVKEIPIYAVRQELDDKYNVDKNRYQEITLDQAISRISSIYPANKSIWKAFGSFYHFSRLFEELGEVHEAFSSFKKTGKKINLEEELADVTAWLLSAWGIHQGTSLSDAIKDYYIDNCPVCNSSPCKCDKYSDRPQMLSDQASMEEVKAKIIELLELNPSCQEEIKELLDTMDSAIATTSTVDAKQVISRAKDILKDVEDAVQTTSNITDNAGKVVTAVRAAYAAIESAKFFWSN